MARRPPLRTRRSGRAPLAGALLRGSADLLLLVSAGALLLGPGSPVAARIDAWREARRTRAVLRDAWPEIVRGGGVLAAGEAGGPVLVEFTDYRCPFCSEAQREVGALVASDPSVRVLVRHLPIETIHPDARTLAAVAVCSEGDPAFPDLHRALFDAPPSADRGDEAPLEGPKAHFLDGVMREVGIDDPEAVVRCASTDRVRLRIDGDLRLAELLALRGTPAFLGRGGVVVGAPGPGGLRRLLGTGPTSGIPRPRE